MSKKRKQSKSYQALPGYLPDKYKTSSLPIEAKHDLPAFSLLRNIIVQLQTK